MKDRIDYLGRGRLGLGIFVVLIAVIAMMLNDLGGFEISLILIQSTATGLLIYRMELSPWLYIMLAASLVVILFARVTLGDHTNRLAFSRAMSVLWLNTGISYLSFDALWFWRYGIRD